jgi:hypothetical protein
MIRPWNWPSRSLRSLLTDPIWTTNDAAVTRVPLIVIDPVIWLVRPTAVACWPASTSLTR